MLEGELTYDELQVLSKLKSSAGDGGGDVILTIFIYVVGIFLVETSCNVIEE